MRDEEKHVTYIQVDEISSALFNELDREFIRFELRKYLMLPGIYSKQLYRLLKQWRTKGDYAEKLDEWRILMDVPQSYKTKDITRRVIDPAIEALHHMTTFSDLHFEYLRTGQKATHVHFMWKPEKPGQEKQDKIKKTAVNKLLGTDHSPEDEEKWMKYIKVDE